jgi:aspartate aminotransferase
MSDIEEHRKKIEEITLEMIKLLKARTDIAKQIGNAKASLGMTVTDEEREDALRSQVAKLCKEIDLDQSTALKFLNLLLNESVKVQSESKQTHLSVFLKAKALEEEGKKIIHLEVGEPDWSPPKEVKTALAEVYDKGYGKYGSAKGITELRTALANRDRENGRMAYGGGGSYLRKEKIMVCPGARFGVYLAITTLLNPGDEIIVIEPAWPAYKDCALNAGIKVRTIKTTLETKWEPSVEQINNTINENTKMIVLNYPNNPTGKILDQDKMEEIMNVARKHDLYVLSDEIYNKYYNFNSNADIVRMSEFGILMFDYKKSIVTKSFSKSHAMTGFRIGYAIAEPSIIEKMSKLQALSLTNVSEPIQYAALQALKDDNSYIRKNTAMITSRLYALIKIAKDIGLEFIEPDGAMYLFARTKHKNFDATEFSEKLLEHGVAIAPGEGFGDYKEFFRITAIDETKLMKGMTILDTVLKERYE